MIREFSHPVHALLLTNVVTLSERAFTYQSSTLSHTDIATSQYDDGTPSTEAPSECFSPEIWKSLSFTFLLIRSSCGLLRLSLPAHLLSALKISKHTLYTIPTKKFSKMGKTQPTLSKNLDSKLQPRKKLPAKQNKM